MSTRTLTDRGFAGQRMSTVGRRLRQGWWSSQPTLVGPTGSATVTADATAHTKGAWAELLASTSEDVDAIIITVSGIGVTTIDTATLLDIGIGAAGSETVLISNVGVGSAISTGGNALVFTVPIFVRQGSRIAARIQSVITGGKTATVAVQLAKTVLMKARAQITPVTFGTSTTTSTGTSMSASANTYVQVVASTSVPLSAISMVPSASATGTAALGHIYTLAVGAAGSEIDLGVIHFTTTINEQLYMSPGTGQSTVIPCDLPAGVRLAVKNTNAGIPYDVTLIGIPRVA